MNDVWNPRQYERFAKERRQPFDDLAALVQRSPNMTIVDLGCGTGELTRDLHRDLQATSTLGIDSSTSMLSRASAFASDGLAFEVATVESFNPSRRFDLVFSNAALHWIENHQSLFRMIREWIAPGGQLAVQMPANHEYASHIVAAEVAREPEFASAIGGFVRESPLLAPEDYAQLLFDLGAVEQSVRLLVYPHVLPSAADVIEWVRGTLLTAYEKRMSSDLYRRFLERYSEALLSRLSKATPFFFPFKRVMLWARWT